MAALEHWGNKAPVYVVDLNRPSIPVDEISGDFDCPSCHTPISPDDQSNESYRVIETKMKGDDLMEMTIRCQCQATIVLRGFLDGKQ